MRFERLDLNLLVALDALLSDRHVTRAGERLGLSQSAMSGALSRLRQHFKDELVLRVGRRMILTPLAESLKIPVRDLLLQTQALLDRKLEFDPATSSRAFSIVASDFVYSMLVADLVRTVAFHGPNISLEILTVRSGHFADELEQGDVDLAVLPQSRASADHPFEPLFEDHWSCLVWGENKSVGSQITLTDYLQRQHVAMNFGRARAQGMEGEYLRALGHERNIVTWVSSFFALPQMVIGTPRIATVPHRLALQAVKTLPLRLVIPGIDFPPIYEVVQWHRYRASDPGVAWLRDTLKGLVGAGSHTTARRTPQVRPN